MTRHDLGIFGLGALESRPRLDTLDQCGKLGSRRQQPEFRRPADGRAEIDVECREAVTEEPGSLAERGGFAYWSHQPNRRISRIAGSGNALLSRLQPSDLLDYALPGRIAGRGVLLANFGEGDAAWRLAITHLSLGAKSRQLQLGFLAELLADSPRLVLMGDFNCDFDAPEMRALYRGTSLEPPPHRIATFPSWAPQRCLDPVLVGGFEVLDYKAVPAAGSDHMAVGVELVPR